MVAPIGRVGASTEASLVLAQLGGIDGRPLDSDRLKGRGMKQSCFRTHLYECLYSRHVPVQPDLASPITYQELWLRLSEGWELARKLASS